MRTSEEKILAGIAHLGILFRTSGITVALIIYVIQKDKSNFAAEHAKQALGYQITLAILFYIPALFGFRTLGWGGHVSPVPGWLLIFWGLTLYAIYAAIKAFTGKGFEYAVIGDFIRRI
ncbi:DUF4870 domain-containing protein [Metallumcola ferriviriculae]|uniref:DUF4870 domain-containing protein n=1 Tax=Metallumcola ferriviriculae TaxID=3039180 RepID=A0AAU0UU20_9FIRM|nr:DUF4870 domain-containing protein [Desulfitibacteraceae bacterium MK1]